MQRYSFMPLLPVHSHSVAGELQMNGAGGRWNIEYQ